MGSSDDGWATYEAQLRPKKLGEAEVSLTKTNILISAKLAEQFQAKRVVLEFRAWPRTIRIRPSNVTEVGYKVSCRSISSPAFYRQFNINERGRFSASLQDGAILVDLQDQCFPIRNQRSGNSRISL